MTNLKSKFRYFSYRLIQSKLFKHLRLRINMRTNFCVPNSVDDLRRLDKMKTDKILDKKK